MLFAICVYDYLIFAKASFSAFFKLTTKTHNIVVSALHVTGNQGSSDPYPWVKINISDATLFYSALSGTHSTGGAWSMSTPKFIPYGNGWSRLEFTVNLISLELKIAAFH